MTKPHRSRKLLRHLFHSAPATIGLCMLVVLGLVSAFAPMLAPQDPYDPRQLSLRDSLLPPVWMDGGRMSFVLGTDDQGRDILSSILYGCRTSFAVAGAVTAIAGFVGVLLGLAAGYYGGVASAIIMRVSDTLYAFSATLVAMLLISVLGRGGVGVLVLAMALPSWTTYARTMRSSVLVVREEEYIQAAKAIGVGEGRLLVKHVLPNAIPPILVIASVGFGAVVILEATLSFLGVGLPITEPSLGMMVARGKNHILAGKWWLTLFPGMTLLCIVMSVNMLADWLRDYINPRLKLH